MKEPLGVQRRRKNISEKKNSPRGEGKQEEREKIQKSGFLALFIARRTAARTQDGKEGSCGDKRKI